MTIRNPVEWTFDIFRPSTWHLAEYWRSSAETSDPVPVARKISLTDVGDALADGIRDFGAYRTDVLFIGLIYPVAGLVLAQLVVGSNMLPLIFPLVSGFALLGPAAAAGLYEMGRRRELGGEVSWYDAFSVVSRPSFTAIAGLTLLLTFVFVLWMAAAWAIYSLTVGPEAPASISQFTNDVISTREGWTMIVAGCGIGFLFALFVLMTSAFSFPMLIDRKVSVLSAVKASISAVRLNPYTMAVWGLIVAASLTLGAIPLLLGLIVVIPVLGHATWHLYRKAFA
jgi:uncharacterized membrane protein